MKQKTKHPLYQTWASLTKRNINVCPEWLASFDKFVEDVGLKPTPNSRLVQKTKGLGYTKNNTKWSCYIKRDESLSPMQLMALLKEQLGPYTREKPKEKVEVREPDYDPLDFEISEYLGINSEVG